ncbi:MAG: DNA repair protein RecO [Betaproteobacteria bacterium]
MTRSFASTGMNDLSADSEVAGVSKRTRPTIGESDRAFVLHTYPYRETSLIVEAFTCQHGRVVLVAKGAKRPHGAMRGLLNPFQALTLNWFGKSEMKTLKSVEQDRIFPQLSGSALLSAFYMNELLLKLTHREDPHDVLFENYGEAVHALAGLERANTSVREIARILRQFEVTFLRELGYALQLNEEADTHAPLEPSRNYHYHAERGPVRFDAASHWQGDALQLAGKTLIDMSNNDYSDPQTQVQAKQLMRKMINHLLGDKILHTRNLIRDLR